LSEQTRRIDPPFSRRVERLRGWFGEWAIDGLLITHPPNLRYLTGFDGSMGAVLLTRSTCSLIVDGRYVAAARAQVARCEELRGVAVELATSSLEHAIVHAVHGAGPLRRVGVEGAMTLSRFDRLTCGLAEAGAATDPSPPQLAAIERAVERARLIKDVTEIGTLREAARMLSDVAREILPLATAGRTERDVAADIDWAIGRAGFDRPAFETIVASGPNSALPHARPGWRRLAPGDGVVLDFGGVYDGYCVDLTRTVQLEPHTHDFARLFDAVHAAHESALRAVRPGGRASDVDGAARTVLTARGLGEAFLHGTGHGLGLEVHEEPRISKPGVSHADALLEPGMVFTIEPGAYVGDLGGVRIEDDVLVTEEGCELLTDVPIHISCAGA
jgi:Xaa-Pro aminopeptidase